jgi:hypothetical protein
MTVAATAVPFSSLKEGELFVLPKSPNRLILRMTNINDEDGYGELVILNAVWMDGSVDKLEDGRPVLRVKKAVFES